MKNQTGSSGRQRTPRFLHGSGAVLFADSR